MSSGCQNPNKAWNWIVFPLQHSSRIPPYEILRRTASLSAQNKVSLSLSLSLSFSLSLSPPPTVLLGQFKGSNYNHLSIQKLQYVFCLHHNGSNLGGHNVKPQRHIWRLKSHCTITTPGYYSQHRGQRIGPTVENKIIKRGGEHMAPVATQTSSFSLREDFGRHRDLTH